MKRPNGITVLVLLGLAALGSLDCASESPTEADAVDTFLEPGAVLDCWPKWHPTDGDLIGYTHVAKDYRELLELGEHSVWTVSLSSGATKHIGGGILADWAPDGKRILIHGLDGGLYLRDLETDAMEQVPVRGDLPDFAPCGTRLGFSARTDSGHFIYVFNMTSCRLEQVGPGIEIDWSPDGETLLSDSLVLLSDEGERLGKVPYELGYGYPHSGRWSPDGKEIVFSGYSLGAGSDVAIWLTDADGLEQRMIACPGVSPAWSPDGRTVAYSAVSEDDDYWTIWVVGSDGTGKRRVTFP
jgi:WD40 repeat protein